MSYSPEPIHLGSPRFTTIDSGAFRVTEAWFPPGAVLEPHTHDRAILAVMLDGSLTTSIAHREIECQPLTAWTEPCGETHSNWCGTAGARVVITQPDPACTDVTQSFAGLLDGVTALKDPIVALDARRIATELAAGDSLTPLVLDSLIMLTLARAARDNATRGKHSRVLAPWLARARDFLHDHFREGIGLHEVAQSAQVTPWHVAHSFRRYFGTSVGEYARALRVNWALERLALTDEPISGIAVSAGFADQSHLTRACKAITGLPPALYRRRQPGKES